MPKVHDDVPLMSAEASAALARVPSGPFVDMLTPRDKERCTNCTNGVQRAADGFVFTCGSCGGEGWVYGDAARTVRSIRAEMEEEQVDICDGSE